MCKGRIPSYNQGMDRRFLLRRAALAACLLLTARAPACAQADQASVSVREAYERRRSGASLLVDIRTPEEWADTGLPEGAIPLDMTSPAFEAKLAALSAENPGKPIDLICRTANRTRQVQEALSRRGWRNLVNVRGGVLGNPGNPGWLAEKLPVAAPR